MYVTYECMYICTFACFSMSLIFWVFSLFVDLRMKEHLASGEFGNIHKGIWNSPYADKDVAVKTLKSSAKDEERLKFLQEAAIMAQFRHPHIVKLFGAVTMDEPVSCMRWISIFFLLYYLLQYIHIYSTTGHSLHASIHAFITCIHTCFHYMRPYMLSLHVSIHTFVTCVHTCIHYMHPYV